MMAKQKRRIYCRFCDYFCYEADDFVSHLEKHHDEMIPEDMSPWQFSYYLRTGKTHGNCVICKGKTSWNEKTHKYNRLCEKPKCKETYINIFKNRMIGKYGKTTLLNDPEQQKKMLANRQISGEYTWRDHVHKTTYTGSYEKSFLEFLDVVMNFDPNDIIAPSPHTYWYTYEGQKHFYIPDFFIPSLELEIEIKDGGDNPNMHSKIQNVDKVKEKLKDDVMMNNQFNYIKIVNKDNSALFKFLELAKEREFDKVQKPIFIIESEESVYDGELLLESVYMESIHKSSLSKNFKKKDSKDIDSSALDIHSTEAKEYIDNDSYLSSLKPKLKDFVGEIIVDNDKKKIIGRFLIGTGKDAGFIGALRVNDAYKGYGFGAQLIDDAVKKYNGIDLIVLKDNEVALNLYKKHGFVIVDIKGIGKNEYYMKLKSKVNKDDKIITESIDIEDIDTVIFDLGSVLVKNTFRENIVNSKIPDEDYEYLIFKYAEMSQHITETMSTDEAIELFKTSLKPEFKKYAKEIFTVLNIGIKPFEFTESMIKNLKDKGYKVYYLSNWNRASFELCKEKGLFDFLKLFNGGIVSYEVDMMKPEKTIYNLLIDKFSINPSKAIFFDDRKENVDAAISVGLHAEVFDVKKHTEYDIFSLKDVYEAVNTITMDDIKSFNKELNSWDYGVLINGKKYTKSSEIDWSQYKTIPIKDIEKHHVGICWDFVNYQHNWFRGAGIKDESYLFVMQLSDNPDDIVTHTFSIITFEGKKYWFESSWFGHQGVREIRSYKDVIDELIAKYDKGNNHSYSVFKYSPDGMDKNITNGDFFNKATRSLVYDHKGKEKE